MYRDDTEKIILKSLIQLVKRYINVRGENVTVKYMCICKLFYDTLMRNVSCFFFVSNPSSFDKEVRFKNNFCVG